MLEVGHLVTDQVFRWRRRPPHRDIGLARGQIADFGSDQQLEVDLRIAAAELGEVRKQQRHNAVKKLRDGLLHQGPTWAAITAALLCSYALTVSLSLSQPTLC